MKEPSNSNSDFLKSCNHRIHKSQSLIYICRSVHIEIRNNDTSMSKGIPSRNEDYSQWYNELVKKADLAEHSDVRGCMVIKPYGFSIWEKMQAALDRMFKDTGHVNAYFPLFVPKSLFEAEEKNAEGFAKECAIVTHYRLKNDPNNKGKL